MPPGLKEHKGYLDGKECLELWCNTGSVYKARVELYKKGKVHPITGKMPSHQGVWNSSALFMLNNQLEARRIVDETWKAKGHLLSDKDWYMMITKNARYLLSDKSFKQFIAKNEYLKPYEELARELVKSKRSTKKGQEIPPVVIPE